MARTKKTTKTTKKASKPKKTASKSTKTKSDDKTSSLDAGLYIVSTPIGNLSDITLRALEVLGDADTVLCEDQRVTRKLLCAHGISAKTMTYHEHNAEKQRPKVIKKLSEGAVLALVTDAGTPLISDPGYKLVSDVRREGFDVIPVPGPSALLAALVGSAMPTDRFLFAGFLPPKRGSRQSKLSSLANYDMTLVFYESGNRLEKMLKDVFSIMGDRQVTVARELTKKFEEFITGSLQGILQDLEVRGQLKGEIVVIVGPPTESNVQKMDDDVLDEMLGEALGNMGMSVRDASAYVAEETGVQKRKLYARALALTHAGRSDVDLNR